MGRDDAGGEEAVAELSVAQQKAIALARARLEIQHGGYLHPDDMAASDPGLALPINGTGAQSPAVDPTRAGIANFLGGVPGIGTELKNAALSIGAPSNVAPSQTFGMSSSDTLNPLPAIAAFGDQMFGNIPIAGKALQGARDQVNANVYGGTPEEARADINKTVAANPEAATAGAVAGKALPYVAAAMNPVTAGALGLEGSLGLRLLMGGASSEAINFGDNMSKGQKPLEALGNATRDTTAELPFFAFGTKSGRAAATKAAPTVAELEAQAKPLYDAAKQSGLVISQPSVDHFVHGLTSKVMQRGLDPTLTPKSVAAIKRLQDMAGKNMTIEDAMTLREVLGNAAIKTLDGSPKDHGIAVSLLKDFDNFLEGVTTKGPQGQANMAVLAGDAVAAHSNLVAANKLWSKAQKGKMLDLALAEATTKSEGGDISLEKAIRNEFKALELDIVRGDMPGFTPQEIKIIKEVARGAGAQRIARTIGRLKAGGPVGVSSLATTGGFAGHVLGGGNPAAQIAGAALGGGLALGSGMLGAGGRVAAGRMARGNAKYASAVARSGNVLGPGGVGGALSGADRAMQAAPLIAGRTATTMTLGEWTKQQQPVNITVNGGAP
jgi:hypothetical protein